MAYGRIELLVKGASFGTVEHQGSNFQVWV